MNKFNKVISTPLVMLIIVVIVLIGGCILYYYITSKTQPVACSEEAKICPDGSAVSRTGPDCEFAQCPNW